jgi:hypothetical protein
MKPEDLGKKSVRRNAMIADFFHRIGAVEKIGSGITRMKEMMVSRGLPEPRYEFTSFFTVIFARRPQIVPHVTTERAERETLLRRVYEGVREGAPEGVPEGVKVRLSREIVKIYEYGLCSVPQSYNCCQDIVFRLNLPGDTWCSQSTTRCLYSIAKFMHS